MTELELLHRADDQEIVVRMAYLIEGIYKRGSALGIDLQYMAELAKLGRAVAYRQMRDQIDAETAA
jgi:hypothetical protein